MRLTKISFYGFKRLENTSCNVDGKLIAFLGANEAGKSSVLEGLSWLSDGTERLPDYKRTRNVEIADDDEVVRALFQLSDDELESLSEIATEVPPKEFVMVRTAGGAFRRGAFPRPEWPHQRFDAARELVTEISEFIDQFFVKDEELSPIQDVVSKARSVLADPDAADKRELPVLGEVAAGVVRLRDDTSLTLANSSDRLLVSNGASQLLGRIEDVLPPVLKMIGQGHPKHLVAKKLLEKAPEFVLFSDEDRNLSASYELGDDSLRANPPRALVNLLKSAGITLDEVYQSIIGGDTTRRKSLLKRANMRLAGSLGSYWQQRKLSLTIDTDASTLQVLIDENDEDETVTTILERSEGLRSFVALLCFLAVQKSARPQILLIDEAENHLHIDAQADLINMLSSQNLAQQVLYTTHSPACLPSDLGSCVRLVEPIKSMPGMSRLKNNFWQDSSYGFGPLLFAMGAGAAAFSVCRKALLCEGPSEMILLPTLMRLASGVEQLNYQVAPGLSVVAKREIDSGSVASQVLYLTDGDSGGRAIVQELERAGVPKLDIFSFDENCALEDMVAAQVYVDAVNDLISDAGDSDVRADLNSIKGPYTISKNLETWASSAGVKLPSKVAVASRLVMKSNSNMLSVEGKKVLVELHKKLIERFDVADSQVK